MKPPISLPWVGGLLGAGFFLLVYGASILDTSNIAWLLHDDPAQHYLGFAFFRDALTWPPGRIPAFGAPSGTTIVFTDSIPLAAFLFRPFSAVLPVDFQYFGLWQLLCHGLFGVYAMRLLQRLSIHRAVAVIAVALLLTSPAMALRAYGHEALMAHWLLLAAFDTVLSRRSAHFWPWLVIASLIHAYWVALIIPFACVGWLRDRLPPATHLIGAAFLLAVMFLAGYFSAAPSQLAAQGYGEYSANLLTFFDPMNWSAFLTHYGRSSAGAGEWSRLLPALGQSHPAQYEGFAYLGAGALLLLAIALASTVFDRAAAITSTMSSRASTAQSHPPSDLLSLWLPALLMFVFALSTTVGAGQQIILQLSPPSWLVQVLSVFRSTGRFVWPLALLLVIWSVVVIARQFPKHATLILAASLCLQAVDLSPKWAEFRQRFTPHGIGQLPDYAGPGWSQAERFRHLVSIPAATTGDDWIPLALHAARHHQTINAAYVARADLAAIKRNEGAHRQRLLAGEPEPCTAYLIRDQALLAQLPHTLALTAVLYPVYGKNAHLILPNAPCSAPSD